MNKILMIAWILAGISSFVVPPDMEYLNYIDFHTLGLLFCLMAVMAGLSREGVFGQAAGRLITVVKNSRQMELILVFLCFVFSMLITNDVALITFVPFAIQVLEMANMRKRIVPVIVMQTVAANLGSMFTPIGNPQNLYLYSKSGMTLSAFFKLMLPYTLLAAVMLLGMILLRKCVVLGDLQMRESEEVKNPWKVAIYAIIFLLCLLCVAHLLPVWVVMLVTILAVFVMDRGTFKEIDYSLLLTFAGFFIFIGNMGRISMFCNFLKSILNGNEILTAVISSQVISNVPAALLLSGFTDQWSELIIGTNLGGLGTMIASMASLISYRFLIAAYPEEKRRYTMHFTVVNLGFLLGFLIAMWSIRIW